MIGLRRRRRRGGRRRRARWGGTAATTYDEESDDKRERKEAFSLHDDLQYTRHSSHELHGQQTPMQVTFSWRYRGGALGRKRGPGEIGNDVCSRRCNALSTAISQNFRRVRARTREKYRVCLAPIRKICACSRQIRENADAFCRRYIHHSPSARGPDAISNLVAAARCACSQSIAATAARRCPFVRNLHEFAGGSQHWMHGPAVTRQGPALVHCFPVRTALDRPLAIRLEAQTDPSAQVRRGSHTYLASDVMSHAPKCRPFSAWRRR